MAAAAGARLDRMDQANVHPALPTRYHGKPHGLPMVFQAEPHSIVVNRYGQRFVSENDFNIGGALDQRDPKTGEPLHLPAHVVGDHRFLGRSLPFRWYASYEKNWVIKARTLDELAVKINVPADALKATVERFNSMCDQGRDIDFHRGESSWENYKAHGPEGRLGRIDKPPYIAMSMNRSILGTKGGARTNEYGQVLREDGSIIAGLYAAGLAMANPLGTRSVGAGTTIGPNMTWGYICAETMLRQNRQ
jgi:3-oxosteroid 1-dehydrogenase